jgi:hypothetical protein
MITLWTANDALPATVTWTPDTGLTLRSADGAHQLVTAPDGTLSFVDALRDWLRTGEGRGLQLRDPATGTALALELKQVRLLTAIIGTAFDDDVPAPPS